MLIYINKMLIQLKSWSQEHNDIMHETVSRHMHTCIMPAFKANTDVAGTSNSC